MKKTHTAFDYSYIDKGIYVGTNECCQMHFDQELLRKGVTADISLEKERIDQPLGVEFYTWIPVKDHESPSKDQFRLGVAALDNLVSLKKKVYVHCKNGHGRAPTLVAAYFIKHGRSPKEAEKFIKSKRPTIHLREGQRKALRMFRRSL